ncbi:DUF2474 family protein [Phenylobacterium montanum]|uniref:DUF2474 family protein n=1 Tax=Phenylobacterium montanum TaxID=2823693 RepID=A0A975IW86_9CAUL|nr:DUF2474 family protein [Caulobacter sp. S6]QUD88126.1 DUF2474 family protein [Caulobacter sp. S6]
MRAPAGRQWAWFVGLWAASVLAVGLTAGVMKAVFGLILR